MRCDVIAEGIIKATKELELSIPLVVRLQGTKEAEAKKCVFSIPITIFRTRIASRPTRKDADLSLHRMIKESGLKIFPFDGLDEAASKAVEMAK